MYYTVTIYYGADVDEEIVVGSDTFSVDTQELLAFITFITTRVAYLHSFNVEVKYY